MSKPQEKQQRRPMIQIALPATTDEDLQSVQEPIATGWLTQGPKVKAFEDAFAARHRVDTALATTSCTTALHLALVAYGIGPGDEVIVPSFTWVATANVVLYCGATPVLCDVERSTFNIDVADALKRVTDKTKAIIPVHLFGLCADIDALKAGLPDRVKIIEDAACAAGAIYKGSSAGSLGDAGCFSFHPRKIITTGEGGMITTNDKTFAELADSLRNHGASVSEEQRHHGPKPYILADFDEIGFNYRMTDLQGALGLSQLGKLDDFIAERAKWAAWYKEELSELDWLRIPDEPEGGKHSWQSFVTYVDQDKAPMSRNEIMERLHDQGVSTRPGTHAVHMLGAYQTRFGFNDDNFPAARDCQMNTMAIPLHNRMTEEDYNYVVKCLKSF